MISHVFVHDVYIRTIYSIASTCFICINLVHICIRPATRCDLIFTALHRSFQVLHMQGMSRIENLDGSYLHARPFAWWQTKSDVVLASKMKK